MKTYYPNYGKAVILDEDHAKLSLGKTTLDKGKPIDYRDDVNLWLENSLF